MTNVDLLLGVLMFGFFGWGAFKGLLWTVVRLASYIGTFLLISASGEQVRDFLLGFVNISPLLAMMIVYVLLFVFMVVLGQVVYMILIKVTKSLKLGGLNRLAGGVFWLLSFFLLLSFMVVLFDVSPLSLNGRGVRPKDHKLDFSKMTSKLSDLVSAETDQLSEMNNDLLQEALEKAEKKFQNAGSKEESELARQELYETMKSSMKEESFNKIVEEIDLYNRETLKFNEKELTVDSAIIRNLIEPLTNFLENKLLGFT